MASRQLIASNAVRSPETLPSDPCCCEKRAEPSLFFDPERAVTIPFKLIERVARRGRSTSFAFIGSMKRALRSVTGSLCFFLCGGLPPPSRECHSASWSLEIRSMLLPLSTDSSPFLLWRLEGFTGANEQPFIGASVAMHLYEAPLPLEFLSVQEEMKFAYSKVSGRHYRPKRVPTFRYPHTITVPPPYSPAGIIPSKRA